MNLYKLWNIVLLCGRNTLVRYFFMPSVSTFYWLVPLNKVQKHKVREMQYIFPNLFNIEVFYGLK